MKVVGNLQHHRAPRGVSRLDWLVHNAHRLILKGESLRKAAAKRQNLDAEPGRLRSESKANSSEYAGGTSKVRALKHSPQPAGWGVDTQCWSAHAGTGPPTTLELTPSTLCSSLTGVPVRGANVSMAEAGARIQGGNPAPPSRRKQCTYRPRSTPRRCHAHCRSPKDFGSKLSTATVEPSRFNWGRHWGRSCGLLGF